MKNLILMFKTQQASGFILKIFLPLILIKGSLFSQTGGLPYPFQNFVAVKKQRLFHYPKGPMFQGRKHNIDFITDVPTDSITAAILFFKTDSMKNYREFPLAGNNGLFRFQYDPRLFPADAIEYFFMIQARSDDFYAVPLNSKGELIPSRRLFTDPVLYYQQKMSADQ